MREQVLLVRHDWDGYLLRRIISPGQTDRHTPAFRTNKKGNPSFCAHNVLRGDINSTLSGCPGLSTVIELTSNGFFLFFFFFLRQHHSLCQRLNYEWHIVQQPTAHINPPPWKVRGTFGRVAIIVTFFTFHIFTPAFLPIYVNVSGKRPPCVW